MSHTRLHFPHPISDGAILELGSDQARYVGRVLRSKPGDQLSVFNGDDGEWQTELVRIRKSDATLRVLHRLNPATESPLALHLVQGISRGDRMDFVMQKATELGVKRLTPVLADHGMVRLTSERAARRQAHWQSIANSACEQCGRVSPPVVDQPLRLNDWFGEQRDYDASRLILRPQAGTPLSAVAAPAGALCLLVGPEGGFSPREYDDAAAAGFSPVDLGPRVLRTETAAVTALALAQSLWGDLQS
ncbi:MAG: 16S rRNA (uracil(1498)-N(3))-methyltransferase [Woeseiaceae bacterium]|nr:16S rRNA (uracil(1498)-N(3))-methyltransferase [Woeseiaceae bacterium]